MREGDLIALGIGALMCVAVGVAMTLAYASCGSKAKAMHLQYSWGPLQDCIVEYKGERVPISAVGVRSIEMHEAK